MSEMSVETGMRNPGTRGPRLACTVAFVAALAATTSGCSARSETPQHAADRWAERAASVVEPPLAVGPFEREAIACETGGVSLSTRFDVAVQSPRMDTLVDDMKDAFRAHGWDDLVDKPVGLLGGTEHDGRGVWLYPPIPRSDDGPGVFLDWNVETEILTVVAASDCVVGW
ncbi:hypothetical protein GCM10027406_28600 [Leifsonia lichenia]